MKWCHFIHYSTSKSEERHCPAASGKLKVQSLAELRTLLVTQVTEGVTVDCKCRPFVDIRWSSPYLSEPNQQNKQHHCLPGLPSLPPPHSLSWVEPRCSPMWPGPPGQHVALWTWANRPANLGTRVTSAALITLHYLCRRLPHRHPSAQSPCHLFCKFTLTLWTRPAAPSSFMLGLVKVQILEAVHA